ncbi:hypothetical protein ABKN59_011881 [Abortiporus biennis]
MSNQSDEILNGHWEEFFAMMSFVSAAALSLLVDITVNSFFAIRTWAIWGWHFFPLLLLSTLALYPIVLSGVTSFAITYEGISPLQMPYGGCKLSASISDDVQDRRMNIFTQPSQPPSNLMYLMPITLFLNEGNRVVGLVVIVGPSTWLVSIVLSCMILDLKVIDQVTMASLPEIYGSCFNSINFIGNIGCPLDMSPMGEIGEDEAETSRVASISQISVKQIVEDPLSIDLLDDEYYGDSNGERCNLIYVAGSHVLTSSLEEMQDLQPLCGLNKNMWKHRFGVFA